MFILSLKISSPPGRRAELLKTLKLLTSPVVVMPGCVMCRLYEDTNVRGDLLIVEEWQTRESIISYLKTDHFKKILTVTELSSACPQIRCEELTNQNGVEAIRTLMNS